MHLVKPLAPALLAAGLLVAGCGSGSSAGGSGAVSAKAQAALEPFLADVRQAAASGDRAAVQQAVRRLKHEVNVEADGISTSRQAAIDNAADAVLNDIHPSPTASTPPPSPSETETSAPPTTPPPTVTPVSPPPTVTPVSPPPVTSLPPSQPPPPSDGGGGDGGGGGNSQGGN